MTDLIITKAQFARDIGCSAAFVTQSIQSGLIKTALTIDAKGKERLWRHAAAEELLRNMPHAGAKNPEMYTKLLELSGQAAPDSEGESYEEAKRRKMVSDANIQKLKEQKLSGELVSREAVNEELFEAGKRIRESLLQIPDSIVDDVMASTTRDEAHNVIYEALEAVLIDVVKQGTENDN